LSAMSSCGCGLWCKFTAWSGSLLCAPLFYARMTGRSWRVNETYVKIRRQWVYRYRAVNPDGNTVDFRLSRQRDVAAALNGKPRFGPARPISDEEPDYDRFPSCRFPRFH
jgi:hypothetical protein